MFNVFRQNLSRSQGGDNPRSPYLVACGAKASRGHWRANSETGPSETAAFCLSICQKAFIIFFIKPEEGVISSFFGTFSIYWLPEDNYWSSGIVVYRLNLLRNDEPFLIELAKLWRPSLYITPLVGKRKVLIPKEEI